MKYEMRCVGGDFVWFYVFGTLFYRTICVHYIEEGRKTIIRKEVPLGKVLKLLEKEHSHPCAYEAQFQA